MKYKRKRTRKCSVLHCWLHSQCVPTLLDCDNTLWLNTKQVWSLIRRVPNASLWKIRLRVKRLQIRQELKIRPHVSVWTMDLPAVCLVRRLWEAARISKRNCSCTLWRCSSFESKGHCYPWTEIDGDLSTDVLVDLQCNVFKEVLLKYPNVKELIIWFDGCGYQNRNSCVSNASMLLAQEMKVTIILDDRTYSNGKFQCAEQSRENIAIKCSLQAITKWRDRILNRAWSKFFSRKGPRISM